MVFGLHRCLAVLVIAAVVTGCAREQQPAASAVEVAEARCVAAVRDIRTWCTESLRDSSPELRYNCLEARLRFDSLCFPQQD